MVLYTLDNEEVVEVVEGGVVAVVEALALEEAVVPFWVQSWVIGRAAEALTTTHKFISTGLFQ